MFRLDVEEIASQLCIFFHFLYCFLNAMMFDNPLQMLLLRAWETPALRLQTPIFCMSNENKSGKSVRERERP